MGTRQWKRISVLADRAVKQRKRPLAVAVFEAALSPGMHRVLAAEIRATEKGQMESRSETLSATDVVNKGQGDGFSVRADNLQIWLCDRIRGDAMIV